MEHLNTTQSILVLFVVSMLLLGIFIAVEERLSGSGSGDDDDLGWPY